MECGKHIMLIFFLSSLTLGMVEAKDHKIILESGYNLQVMFLFIFIFVNCREQRWWRFVYKERPKTSNSNKPLLIKASVNLRNILQVYRLQRLLKCVTLRRAWSKKLCLNVCQWQVSEKEQLVSLETTLRLFWKVNMERESHPYMKAFSRKLIAPDTSSPAQKFSVSEAWKILRPTSFELIF